MNHECVFCAIVKGDAPATVIHEWEESIALVPLNPVCEGHFLVIPRAHYPHASSSPATTGLVFKRAAQLALPPYNLITSAGQPATQSIFHLHVHIVPRHPSDGLRLPWTAP